MYFVKNLEMAHAVGGGRGGRVMLFTSLWRTAYKNRYVTHSLHLNTFGTIEKVEPETYDKNSVAIDFSIIFFQKIALDLTVTK